MRWLLCLLPAGLLVVAGQLPVGAGDKAADYLKDGMLKERIEVHEITIDPGNVESGPKSVRKSYLVAPDGSGRMLLVIPTNNDGPCWLVFAGKEAIEDIIAMQRK